MELKAQKQTNISLENMIEYALNKEEIHKNIKKTIQDRKETVCDYIQNSWQTLLEEFTVNVTILSADTPIDGSICKTAMRLELEWNSKSLVNEDEESLTLVANSEIISLLDDNYIKNTEDQLKRLLKKIQKTANNLMKELKVVVGGKGK